MECTKCTFLNLKNSNSCTVCGNLLYLSLDENAKQLFLNCLFTNEPSNATPDFILGCKLVTGLDLQVFLIFRDKNMIPLNNDGNLNVFLYKKESKIKGKKNRKGKNEKKISHYVLVLPNGNELDTGMYITDPTGKFPESIRDKYFSILKKIGVTKKTSNCCLPMCLIIGGLLAEMQESKELKQIEKRNTDLTMALIKKETEEKINQEIYNFEMAIKLAIKLNNIDKKKLKQENCDYEMAMLLANVTISKI